MISFKPNRLLLAGILVLSLVAAAAGLRRSTAAAKPCKEACARGELLWESLSKGLVGNTAL